MKKEEILIIGSGVSGICLATKLVDNGYPGELITILDKGQDPYHRPLTEVMCGFAGAGLFSDGKLTYHTAIGGQLAKYCGEQKAYDLMDQVIKIVTRFHPKPEVIMKSNPESEPDFIKPYFGLRLFPVYHIGSDYLHEIGKSWYDYLRNNGVNFRWEHEVFDVSTSYGITIQASDIDGVTKCWKPDKLIVATGKSGIDFSSKLSKQLKLETEVKSVQLGVRFEAPQKYFQKLIDISYDFKLYKKLDNVSLRTFCTNNNAAYVAVENTYGDVSYNGHALKDESKLNGMTNFGVLMEIKGIDNPFEWSRDIVQKCQIDGKGLYYSPSRTPSKTSEGNEINAHVGIRISKFIEAFGVYSGYVLEFIEEMNKTFKFGDDWGIYIPEVKYVSPEPVVDHANLSLKQNSNVFFVGDALSARGITVSGAQGIYVAEHLLA